MMPLQPRSELQQGKLANTFAKIELECERDQVAYALIGMMACFLDSETLDCCLTVAKVQSAVYEGERVWPARN